MLRTQIQLEEAQVKAIKRIAAERSVSMAEVIREAVSRLLAEESSVGREERRMRAAEVAGSFRTGIEDLSVEHDRYFAETIDP